MTHDHWFIPALWPDGTERPWVPWRPRTGARYVAIPSRTNVQQLIPWRWTSAVAAAQRVSDDRSRFSRLRDAGGVAALLGVAALSSRRRLGVSADRSIVDHVTASLGLASPTYGTFLFGPARANRKPVIQIHDRRGRTLVWVKVATSELTKELLTAEVDVLGRLGERPLGFRIPSVLGRGSFGDADWAALEPMTVERRTRPSLETFDRIASSIESTAPQWSGATADSPLVARLRHEANGLEHAPGILERLIARRPSIELAAAHGDLVPWNMLSGAPDTAVWDWERYVTTAPVGFDRIHRRVQVAVQQGGLALEDAVARAESDLRSSDDASVEAWAAHVDWYLAVMLCRYERDARRHANPRLVGRIEDLARVLNDRGAQ